MAECLRACVTVFSPKNGNPLGMEAFREKENGNKATTAVIAHMKEITQSKITSFFPP